MTVAEAVIQRFGGIASLARALGHSNRSTVQGWAEAGVIPIANWPGIERAASINGCPEITVGWLGEHHAKESYRIAAAKKARA